MFRKKEQMSLEVASENFEVKIEEMEKDGWLVTAVAPVWFRQVTYRPDGDPQGSDIRLYAGRYYVVWQR